MYEEMTAEQLTETLLERDATIAALQTSEKTLSEGQSDLTAERDSLKEELDALKDAHTKIVEELQETKKLNYTLARTIGASSKTQEQINEEAYKDAFAHIR